MLCVYLNKRIIEKKNIISILVFFFLHSVSLHVKHFMFIVEFVFFFVEHYFRAKSFFLMNGSYRMLTNWILIFFIHPCGMLSFSPLPNAIFFLYFHIKVCMNFFEIRTYEILSQSIP